MNASQSTESFKLNENLPSCYSFDGFAVDAEVIAVVVVSGTGSFLVGGVVADATFAAVDEYFL